MSITRGHHLIAIKIAMSSKINHIHTIVLGSLDTPLFDKCFESCRRVFSPAGIAPACLTPGGGRAPKILIEL